ncbi:hypothetical protein CIPAW_03G148600 [Carya illinoinensis]|uniref:Uncharacterized protein n=1 Tax=Carya illinoinensis TaxID=32201 RepID=A0A8T1R2Y3_CARIL|nr:hypothetical protein CIPAW_03G148600 [Carya illinoinensis]KAG6661058.1 hypothetical protein CIPAW_03G148600 [Carya illinoinensis]
MICLPYLSLNYKPTMPKTRICTRSTSCTRLRIELGHKTLAMSRYAITGSTTRSFR